MFNAEIILVEIARKTINTDRREAFIFIVLLVWFVRGRQDSSCEEKGKDCDTSKLY